MFKALGKGSDTYGPCELCGQHADQLYIHDDFVFAHRACIEAEFYPSNTIDLDSDEVKSVLRYIAVCEFINNDAESLGVSSAVIDWGAQAISVHGPSASVDSLKSIYPEILFKEV